MNKESAAHLGWFISVKVKKVLRIPQAQFQEKLRNQVSDKTMVFL